MGKTKFNKSKNMSIDKRQSKDIKKLKKKVANLEAPIERKFLDSVKDRQLTASDNITNWAHIVNKVKPWAATGSSASAENYLSSRLGKSITMKSLKIKGELYIDPEDYNTNSINTKVRILVVRYKCPGNTNTELCQPICYLKPAAYISGGPSPAPPGAGIGNIYVEAFKNRTPVSPYEILYDKIHLLQNSLVESIYLPAPTAPVPLPNYDTYNTIPTEHYRKTIDISIKLKNLEASWSDPANTQQQSATNQICVYALQNKTTVQITNGSAAPKLRVNCRLHYVDM